MRSFKNFLILPKFQVKLVVAGIIPVLIVFTFLYFQFQNSFDRLETHMTILGTIDNPQVINAVQAQETLIMRYFIVGTFIGIIFSFLFLTFVSHKLAGPVYRLKKELNSGRENGQMHKLNFRDGDYLKELEDDLNHFMVHDQEEKKAS